MNILNKYLGDADRANRYYLSRKFEPLGLGRNRFIFFVTVARYPGVSQAEICRITLFDRAIVARSVEKIEELGYIHREYFDGDRKTQHLYLTEEGKRIYKEAVKVVNDWNLEVCREIGADPEEVETLLQKLSDVTRKRVHEEYDFDCIVTRQAECE